MNEFYQTALYLKVIRPTHKSIQHCCTGQSEIQRIAKNISFKDLEFSLKHSKQLRGFVGKHPLTIRINEQAFQQLCSIKKINGEQNRFYVRKALEQYSCYKCSIRVIEETRKIRYDKNNELHELLLLELWANLMPKQKLQNRISNQWITIGFQVNDPATDFRGAGYLGLLNLINWSRNKKCKAVFMWALNPDTAYFFCSAGLFFTMTAIEIVNEMLTPVQIWRFENETEIFQNFQKLYHMLFLQFDKFWRTVLNKSILQFNKNLLKFKSAIKSSPPAQIKEKIVYWDQI